jgi:hypothetical protein
MNDELLATKRKKEGKTKKERKKEIGRVKYCVWNVIVRERQRYYRD